jgi:hypothetical protein
MPTFFGQPAAENRWFGNELIIPPAELREPTVLVPVPVPEPPAIPLPQPLQYERYRQTDGGSGPNTGPGSAGNFSGYMTPATIDPETSLYSNIGYDPNPTIGKVAAAMLAPVTALGIPVADPAFRGPLSSLSQALGITEAPAGLSQEGLDVATSVEAPTGRERDDMFSNFSAAPAADAPSGRAASDAAKAAALEANPMQAVAWGAGTFGGRKDQIGLDYDVETGVAGPGASNPTVLCGALHSHGLLPDEVYRADQAFGQELATNDPDVMRGYHAWASPIARLMRRCRTLSAVLSVLILPWAHEIYGNSNWLGRFYVKVGIPVCRWVGKRLRHRERPLAI